MITLPDKRVEVLKDLYNKAREKFYNWEKIHSGQWHCGSPAGLDEMIALKRALLILTSSEEKAEEIKGMDDLEIMHKDCYDQN